MQKNNTLSPTCRPFPTRRPFSGLGSSGHCDTETERKNQNWVNDDFRAGLPNLLTYMTGWLMGSQMALIMSLVRHPIPTLHTWFPPPDVIGGGRWHGETTYATKIDKRYCKLSLILEVVQSCHNHTPMGRRELNCLYHNAPAG